ncbi:MAG TPA: hypothetical protein VK338_01450 [Candidatus Nitrosocosmicus sp.]|nr:hypothetical protein [Candidatus Nitrosocosmicus sp.]
MKKPIFFVVLFLFFTLFVSRYFVVQAQGTASPSPATSITLAPTVPGGANTTTIVPTAGMTKEPIPSPTYEACFQNWGCPVMKDEAGNERTVFCEPGKDKWVYDPEVTELGKGGDRARQFVYWALNTKSLDNSSALKMLWATSRNIMYALLIIVAIMMAAGIIIGQRANFDFKVKVWPLILKLALLLLYVTFSYTIVLLLIQLSDILMQFFIKNTGGDKLFNIFFDGSNSVNNYKNFRGCSNLNPDVQESVNTSKFLIKVSNITYYVVGIAIILRKIVLWFLLILAPFLALLAPFVFIRNVGWIWVGVFFQWLFYGPLFGLFLGGVAGIWNSPTHIPFQFVFSQAGTEESIVYPTAIRILYSGPANMPGILNSSNYVDTFAEYVIGLLMLWTAVLLPILLLRIFRDYCCDGIYAMKNILLSMYDNMKSGGHPGPSGPVSPSSSTGSTMSMKFKSEKNIESKIKLESVEDIRRARTEDIKTSMNISAHKLTDIAHFETNKQARETVTRNIEYLQNPMKAGTATDRQKFMNMRTELFDRATKGDVTARQTLAAISSSNSERFTQKETILQSMPQATPVIKTTSIKVGLPQERTSSLVQSIFHTITNNTTVVNNIANSSQTTTSQTHSVLQAAGSPEHISQSATSIVENISKETGVAPEKVKQIITSTSHVFKSQKDLISQIAQKEQVKEDVIQKVMDAHIPVMAQTEQHIEDTVSIPPSVSIEDYEEVKNMWTEQYEKGEVPVTENIKDRAEWVATDIVALTNILNKIMSADPQLKAQGLDEVGYILPIFMINNMKGDELAVYLKSKLEAAKQVKKDLDKEAEILGKVKKEESEEEFVDVNLKKAETQAKTQELSQELPMEEKKEETTIPTTNNVESVKPTEDKAEEVKS